MATDPNTLLPSPPPEALALAARLRAALADKKMSVKDIEKIIVDTGREVTAQTRKEIKANVDYVRSLGGDPDLVAFNFLPVPPPEPGGFERSMFFPEGTPAPQFTDTIAPYDPTFQERAYQFVREQAAPFFGADPQQAREAAELLVSRRDAPRAGLMDITPLAALTSIPEGASTLARGVRFGEPGTAGLGALEVAGGVLEALPLAGPAVKGARQLRRGAPSGVPAAVSDDIGRRAVEALSPSNVPPTVAPIQRIAQAPDIPPTRIAPRRAADERAGLVIDVTPDQVARAEQVADRLTLGGPAAQDFGLVDRAGNIRFDKLNSPADAREAVRQVAETNDEFLAARRGTMTMDEIEDLSNKVPLESLLGRKLGQTFNAEEIRAAKRAVEQSARQVTTARDAYLANPNDANLRESLVESILQLGAFEEQLSGGLAEAGRALRAARELSGTDRSSAIGSMIRTYRNQKGQPISEKNIDDLVDNLVKIGDDPDAIAKFVSDMRKPDFWDKIIEYRTAALLWGPQTHAKNFLGNAAAALVDPIEQAVAAAFGKLTRSADAPTFREVGARAVGLMQGTRDGWQAMRKVLRNEELPDTASKFETPRQGAIGGRTGEIARLPFKLLTLGDEFFKAINRHADLSAQAYRKARLAAGSNAERRSDLYRQYLANPTKEMQEKANEAARRLTFQQDLDDSRLLSTLGKKLQETAQEPSLRGIKFIAPFIRTPVNLANYALERLGLSQKLWKDILYGKGGDREQALAKLTMGLGTTAMVYDMAGKGIVTGGGPSDYRERQALMATGWQPYSFYINGSYYSYDGLEPFATIIGLAADLQELSSELGQEKESGVEDALIGITGAIASNLTDKTFTRGFSEIAEMWTRPEIYGENFVQNFIASFLPNILGQASRAADPTIRETDSTVEAAMARVPGLAQMLPEKQDVWGDPVVRTGYADPATMEGEWAKGLAFAYNVVSPVRVSNMDNSDPVRTEVARLKAPISKLDDKITRKVEVVDSTTGRSKKQDITLDLNQEYYSWINQTAGRSAHAELVKAMDTKEYKSLDDEQKVDFIKNTLSKYRNALREMVYRDWIQNYYDPASEQ